MKVLDLTRNRGQITEVKTLSRFPSIVPPFLKEVKVSGSQTCIYFTNGSVMQDGVYDFEIGTIKIPAGFQYVDYMSGGGTPNWNNMKVERDYDIFSDVLIFTINKSGSFHLCEENSNEENGDSIFMGGSPFGCSGLLRPCNDDNFILFFYDKNLIYLNGQDIPSDLSLPADLKGYYLIPMYTSERRIVYHLVFCFKNKENDAYVKLNLIKENFDKNTWDKNCIAILRPLQLNDKLGIDVTNDIGTAEDAKNIMNSVKGKISMLKWKE
jgi:hypothetical protein